MHRRRRRSPWAPIAAAGFVLMTAALSLLGVLPGPVNLTSPNPVTNNQFTEAYAQAMNRPALIPMPLPALRLLFGSAMVDEALLSGTRVQPRRLLDEGFTFDHPQLSEALAELDRAGRVARGA